MYVCVCACMYVSVYVIVNSSVQWPLLIDPQMQVCCVYGVSRRQFLEREIDRIVSFAIFRAKGDWRKAIVVQMFLNKRLACLIAPEPVRSAT